MKKMVKLGFFCAVCFLFFISCNRNNSGVSDSGKPYHMTHLGLYVTPDGTLMHLDKPYRGIGVNYFDVFQRTILKGHDDTSYKAGLRYLAGIGIPFIRFSASGFHPDDWKLYQANKSEYFASLDDLVNTAEKLGIGLIPSLFWNIQAIPKLFGEPISQLGNPQSKSIAFIKKYTKELVTRYRKSSAIWGWEFGNEVNLLNDTKETSEFSTQDMIIAMKEFAKVVRLYDSSRVIFSGDNIPRPCAYHLNANHSYIEDSINQYLYMLGLQNPDPINTITIHLYPQHEFRFFNGTYPSSLKDILQVSVNEAKKLKKPLFLGEFGAPVTLGVEQEHKKFNELIEGIKVSKVPLAALWVFDFSYQDKKWNITPDNRRQYQLDAIAKFDDYVR